jgi:hypothetical protein
MIYVSIYVFLYVTVMIFLYSLFYNISNLFSFKSITNAKVNYEYDRKI